VWISWESTGDTCRSPSPRQSRTAEITSLTGPGKSPPMAPMEPFNEMHEFFHRTERQDRSHRFAERTVAGIVVAMLICFALTVWLFPTH
jgi:hypothetical protein